MLANANMKRGHRYKIGNVGLNTKQKMWTQIQNERWTQIQNETLTQIQNETWTQIQNGQIWSVVCCDAVCSCLRTEICSKDSGGGVPVSGALQQGFLHTRLALESQIQQRPGGLATVQLFADNNTVRVVELEYINLHHYV